MIAALDEDCDAEDERCDDVCRERAERERGDNRIESG